ncbi:hypothetical protein AZE42_04875 [Rhizopogon vesiculosus]|uniref:Uncharacterized protein n=1 Tax=Rhizopogon vesiculosus TaxID=180088 RepID=A0A1J8QKI2_9AGAM|nr:hypothetical protein AZE42_04875 [Rhizopogon vesiculosus]
MSVILHGTRHLRRDIGGTKYSPLALVLLDRFMSQCWYHHSRNIISGFFTHSIAPGLVHHVPAAAPNRSLVHPAHFHSTAQSVKASYSLPVRNALYHPLSVPRLPRLPPIPGHVANVGLGTTRSFHSARPIFQNVVDNVPIATRTLWEAEWEFKARKKEEPRSRKAEKNVTPRKTKEMLKPKQKPIVDATPTEVDSSELDHYLPQSSLPQVMTYFQMPLAPAPTARLPLSAQSTTGISALHPLLPISDIAATHRMHRNHLLRMSNLFSCLDAADVYANPGVKVDAYAFGPASADSHSSDKQCKVFRVTFQAGRLLKYAVSSGKVGKEELDFDADAEEDSDIELESDDWNLGPGLRLTPSRRLYRRKSSVAQHRSLPQSLLMCGPHLIVFPLV